MDFAASYALQLLALAGCALLLVQRLAVWAHLKGARRDPTRRTAVSVLKPLCGADDGLEENLRAWATLEYPRYELLLGLRDASDPAYPLARAAQERWPRRVKVVLQQGEPGLNPKVNQLCTLERAARHPLLLVSDSNTRPGPGLLEELSALFDDAQVGCVTHPVAGDGHQSLGALLDNLHLASSVGGGQIGAKLLAGRDLVVGKSMALRRSTLQRLGGFQAFANHLAEDYVIGQSMAGLGEKVALGRTPAINVATTRSVRSFFERYARWSVIHRTAISLPTYLAQALLNPWPLTVLALALAPSRAALLLSGVVLAAKAALDCSTGRALGVHGLGARAMLAVPLKDALLFAAWLQGLVSRTVLWRGNRLRVTSGSVLVAEEPILAAPQVGASR